MSVTVRPYRQETGGWHVDIRVPLANGLPYRERKRLATMSKSAALRWGQERERHLLQHGLPEPKKEVPTFEKFWPRFINGHVRANRQKASGIASKEMIGRVHLLPRFGTKPLDAISTEHVQQLKAELTNRAPKTTNNVLTVLNTVLKKAVEWNGIERMPCTVRLLPVPTPSAPFHDFDDYERLVDAARNRSREAHLVVMLGGDAGLRRGEITALQWSDVDFQKRQLSVQRSVWKVHVGIPKGGRSRHVPLTPRLAAVLQASRHLRGQWVFSAKHGTRLEEKAIGDHVDHSARAAKLAQRGIHILRHTFCSHLAMRGAPARAIQELAGHADIRTTLRYMHLSEATLENAIQRLERPIGNIGGNGRLVDR